MKNKVYSFSTDDAIEYGIDAAVLLHNMRYWLDYAKAHGEMEFDGYHWMYATASKMTEVFPFWSANKIQKMLKSLEDRAVIISGNYSKSKFDRTKYYTMPDYSIQPNGGIRISEMADSLYDQYKDSNNDGNTPCKQVVQHQQVLDAYHEILPMMAAVQVFSDKRKTLIRNFVKKRTAEAKKAGHEYTIENVRGYLQYIADHCQWMTEDRPNGRGGYWKAKNFDYIFKDDCYIAVKEQRHDDMRAQ